MAIAEIKWKLVKDTYFFDTTTCYLSEDGNHLFYSGGEKRIEILIDDLNELVRKGRAMWLKLGEYEFGLDKLSKCPTTTWYSINQMLYSLEPWGVMKESKKSARKSIKESINYEVEGLYFFNFDVGEKCSVDLKDAFNADGVISEFYKNENRIYSIVVCPAIEHYFFISYDYRKNKVIHSECFSSYQNAKNEMRDWLKNI